MRSGAQLPTISGIQVITAVFAVAVAAGFYLDGAAARALGVVAGAVVIIVNFWVLVGLGRLVVAAAGRGIGRKLAAILAPVKLLVLLTLVYLILVRTRVDPIGFVVGMSTELAAILFETGRAWLRTAPGGPGQADEGT